MNWLVYGKPTNFCGCWFCLSERSKKSNRGILLKLRGVLQRLNV